MLISTINAPTEPQHEATKERFRGTTHEKSRIEEQKAGHTKFSNRKQANLVKDSERGSKQGILGTAGFVSTRRRSGTSARQTRSTADYPLGRQGAAARTSPHLAP